MFHYEELRCECGKLIGFYKSDVTYTPNAICIECVKDALESDIKTVKELEENK